MSNRGFTFILILFLFSLLSFGQLSLAGQTGKIAGKVTDKQTGEPLVGANVVITARYIGGEQQEVQNLLGAATDFDGYFYILNVPPGSYLVKVSYIGYRTEEVKGVIVDVDKTTQLDIKLSNSNIQTKEVTVTAYAPQKLEDDLTATKQVYDTDNLQTIAGVASLTDILELQADVIDDHFRGGREGESLYLIGGAVINNPLDNTRTFSPITTGLQQVEVYTSGFSAEYGNAQSGVVNMIPKEGGNIWQTSMQISGAIPYYKTWYGSPYSTGNDYYFNTLNNSVSWLAMNPEQPGKPLWDLGYSISSYLPSGATRADSLKIAGIAREAWLQGMRSVGLQYNNTVDYRLDFSIGGPLTKYVKLFVAGRQEVINPDVPMTHPNIERQALGTITLQKNPEDKFSLRFMYDNQYDNYFGSNWYQWLWDRTLSTSQQLQTTSQYGLDWTHVFNHATILNLKANMLYVYSRTNIDLVLPGQYTNNYSNLFLNWVNYIDPANQTIGTINNDYGKTITTTYNFDASLNSQINKWNLLKTGLQFSDYDLDVDELINITDAGSARNLVFNAYPYEGALYVQDKMEFEGFIANLGLRYDFYNFNTTYYSDIFSPLRNPNYNPNITGSKYYDPTLASKTKTELYSRLQPRIGISFPLSTSAVFHLNYGTFTQRPSFDEVFYNQIDQNNNIQILGNPRLRPENTQAYDVGVETALPFGIRLDVSAYYKNVVDLVESAFYEDSLQTTYQTFVNRDYADIKGFHVNIEKDDGPLQGYINYNYGSATGKSSNSLNAPVTYVQKPGGADSVKLPFPQDVYLDYDRTNTAVINLTYKTFSKSGFSLFGVYPIENMDFSVTFKIYSGRPYTPIEAGSAGALYSMRTPTERDLRARIQKTISFPSSKLTIYFEGYNLLNQFVYQYSQIFGSSSTSFNSQQNLQNYEQLGRGVLVYNQYPPYYISQAVALMNNEPMHFRLGLIYNF